MQKTSREIMFDRLMSNYDRYKTAAYPFFDKDIEIKTYDDLIVHVTPTVQAHVDKRYDSISKARNGDVTQAHTLEGAMYAHNKASQIFVQEKTGCTKKEIKDIIKNNATYIEYIKNKETEKQNKIQQDEKIKQESIQHDFMQKQTKYIAKERITNTDLLLLIDKHNITLHPRTRGWIKNRMISIRDYTCIEYYKKGGIPQGVSVAVNTLFLLLKITQRTHKAKSE